jgi:hypothetical protein
MTAAKSNTFTKVYHQQDMILYVPIPYTNAEAFPDTTIARYHFFRHDTTSTSRSEFGYTGTYARR